MYMYRFICIYIWLWKLDLERKRKMNCWYWMNRRNPCGREVDEVGSVWDGQLLPNMRGNLVQSLSLQHNKRNVDIKTLLNEINACACLGSSSVNYRTMWNLEKRHVTWWEKERRRKRWKNNIQKGNAEARMCVENAVCQKNKAIHFLRVSTKVETAAARVQIEALRRFPPLSTHLNANLKHEMFKHHEWKERPEVLMAWQQQTVYWVCCSRSSRRSWPQDRLFVKSAASKKQAEFSEVSSWWASVAERNSSCSLRLFLKQPGVCLGW